MTHAEESKRDEVFQKACELGKTPVTKRQHSKYKLGRGLAFKAKDEAIKALAPKEV